jgi:rSAM/selenodomain-associated transferase 1
MASGKRSPRRSSSFAPHLIVMAKSPVAGRVKRRLAAEIGSTPAIGFYRACLSHTLRRLGSDPRWRSYVAISPDGDTRSALWQLLNSSRTARLAQGGGDLGERMQRLFSSMPPGPVIIVGSDIPAISANEIAKAFRLLGKADAVFGPAGDGGFWLVGLKRTPRVLSPFASVRWSSDKALADTLRTLEGTKVAFVATLDDVDGAGDYRRHRPLWQRLIPARPWPRPSRASGSGA